MNILTKQIIISRYTEINDELITKILDEHLKVQIDNEKNLLCYLCAENKLSVIKKILEENKDYKQEINYSYSPSNNPLCCAIKFSKNYEIVCMLLERGAIINWLDYSLPFIMAIEINNDEIINKILEYKPNLNGIDHLENTPLMMAISKKNDNLIKYLLDLEVDVNKKNIYGYTALHLAIKYNSNLILVKELIKKGANIHAITNNNDNCLMLAASINSKIFELLLYMNTDYNLVNKDNKSLKDLLKFKDIFNIFKRKTEKNQLFMMSHKRKLIAEFDDNYLTDINVLIIVNEFL